MMRRTARALWMPLALLAIAAAPAPEASPDDGPVKRGVDLWEAHEYEGAVNAWRAPAIAGDADAQFNLGQAYKLGNGVPADLRQAEIWYRKAADQGHRQAQALVGVVMFQNGDRAGAVPWLKMSAERGDPRASYVYGTMLFNADNVAKDWPLAYAYVTHAAAAGLPQARSSLAQMDQFIPADQRRKGLALAKDMPGWKAVRGGGARTDETALHTPATAPATALPGLATPTPPATTRPAPQRRASPKAAAIAAASSEPHAAAIDGGWKVQLGAFASPATARGAWSGMSARVAVLRPLHPIYQVAGAMTRLQAGPLNDRAAAQAACTAVKAAAIPCFPVAP